MVQTLDTQHSILDLEGGWLTVWFNRPEKRNALSNILLDEILSALKLVQNDRNVRGILFRGKGGVFCAGADLEELKKITSSNNDSKATALNMSTKIGKVFNQIRKAPQITVSAVEGAGMAGAFGVACASDILVSMSDARFALTETKLGLTPAQIAPHVIARLGFTQARKLMLLGGVFDGQKAFEMGMADYLAKTESELNRLIQDIQEQVRNCSPNAIATTKKLIAEAYPTIDIKRAASLFSECVVSEDGQEGLSSFFEKRKPFWVI